MIVKKAFAKFDLAISISPQKLADGYFPVRYVDCQFDLCDKLYFSPGSKNIEIISNHPDLPETKENFIYKCAVLLKETVGNSKLGAKIKLEKNIPVKAGFGGGSSDAAGTLLGLSELWDIKLSDVLVKKLSKDLGKDFYYSVYGDCKEIIGNGKDYKIKSIHSKLPSFWTLIVVPFFEKPSTGWVYEHVDIKKVGKNSAKLERLKRAILARDEEGLLANLTNDFESYVPRHFPVVSEIKQDLNELGALSSIMAGAGLSVVGFFNSKEKAQVAMNKLRDKHKEIILTKIIN